MYTKEIKEYAKLKMESTDNNTHIARDIVLKFSLDKEVEIVRTFIRYYRKRLNIKAKAQPIKRLFFDIETGYYILKVKAWQMKNYNTYFDENDIINDKKIICISYKWQDEDRVHTLHWDKNQNEKTMLKKFIKVMGEADELVGHNIDSFDIKGLRTRCIANGVLMYPTYRTLDTLKKSRQYFNNASNKLDYLAKWLNVGGKLDHDGMKMWQKVVEDNDRSELKKMINYCERDVVINQDVYSVMSPYIYHNTNFAVLKGENKWNCPECAGKNVEMYKTYTTAMGVVRRNMKCEDCKKQYKISNKTYGTMLHNISIGE